MLNITLIKASHSPVAAATGKTISTYGKHLLPNAITTLQQSDAGHLLTQTLEMPGLVLQKFMVTLQKTSQLHCQPTAHQLLLVYMEKGNAQEHIIEGCGKIALGEQEMRLVYLPASTTHFSSFDKGRYIFYVITLASASVLPAQDNLYQHILSSHNNQDCKGMVVGNVPVSTAMKKMVRNMAIQKDPVALLQKLLHLYTMDLVRQRVNNHYSRLDEERAVRIKEYIDKNLQEKLTIVDLCKHFRISLITLQRAFRYVFWQPIGSYITETRLLHARGLMQKGPDRVLAKQAAGSVRWERAHFSKQFRRRFHLSPIDFAKKKSH